MSRRGEVLEFFIDYEFKEFKRYLKRTGRYKEQGEFAWLETFLRKGLLNLIVLRKDGEIIGNAIWHESNTDEHRKGDPRDKENREALRRLLGGKKDFVELHEVISLVKGRRRILLLRLHIRNRLPCIRVCDK